MLRVDDPCRRRINRNVLCGDLLLPVGSTWHLLDVIDIDVVDPVVEVADIKRETVLVNQLDVVDLLVDVLVPIWLG